MCVCMYVCYSYWCVPACLRRLPSASSRRHLRLLRLLRLCRRRPKFAARRCALRCAHNGTESAASSLISGCQFLVPAPLVHTHYRQRPMSGTSDAGIFEGSIRITPRLNLYKVTLTSSFPTFKSETTLKFRSDHACQDFQLNDCEKKVRRQALFQGSFSSTVLSICRYLSSTGISAKKSIMHFYRYPPLILLLQ